MAMLFLLEHLCFLLGTIFFLRSSNCVLYRPLPFCWMLSSWWVPQAKSEALRLFSTIILFGVLNKHSVSWSFLSLNVIPERLLEVPT